ncbi:hypothetical protein [Brucella tritici]|nr:hypothetical protein [Brucella tritici]
MARPNGSAFDALISGIAPQIWQLFLLDVDAASREAQETYGFLFCN